MLTYLRNHLYIYSVSSNLRHVLSYLPSPVVQGHNRLESYTMMIFRFGVATLLLASAAMAQVTQTDIADDGLAAAGKICATIVNFCEAQTVDDHDW